MLWFCDFALKCETDNDTDRSIEYKKYSYFCMSVKPTARSYGHGTESKTLYSTNHSAQNHRSTNKKAWIKHDIMAQYRHGTAQNEPWRNYFTLIRKRLYRELNQRNVLCC